MTPPPRRSDRVTPRRVLAGIWDFVVGDDWRTAAGVVVAIGATAALEGAGVTAWWLIPLAVLALLVRSLLAAARK